MSQKCKSENNLSVSLLFSLKVFHFTYHLSSFVTLLKTKIFLFCLNYHCMIRHNSMSQNLTILIVFQYIYCQLITSYIVLVYLFLCLCMCVCVHVSTSIHAIACIWMSDDNLQVHSSLVAVPRIKLRSSRLTASTFIPWVTFLAHLRTSFFIHNFAGSFYTHLISLFCISLFIL